MTEVADMNTFANEGSARLLGRAGSFCMERSGYQENDRGMIFFLPMQHDVGATAILRAPNDPPSVAATGRGCHLGCAATRN